MYTSTRALVPRAAVHARMTLRAAYPELTIGHAKLEGATHIARAIVDATTLVGAAACIFGSGEAAVCGAVRRARTVLVM